MNTKSFYMRNPRIVVITSASSVLFVDEKGAIFAHDANRPSLWSLLMQELVEPVLGATLVSRFSGVLSAPGRQVWQRLLDERCIVQAADAQTLVETRDHVFFENSGYHLQPWQPACNHLVLACTGSIVSGLMAPTILSLFYSGFQHRLDVILTEAAQRFLTRDLLESYGVRVWTDAFERKDSIHVAHVQLARVADCILVLPASANSLHRLAHAACTDLLSMIVSATASPIILAPVMNGVMWNNRAVQRNVQRLRDDGMHIIEPTLIFGASDGEAMYGGHGTLWAGPSSLMHAVSAVLAADAGARRHPE